MLDKDWAISGVLKELSVMDLKLTAEPVDSRGS